jgi:hypothetical protein
MNDAHAVLESFAAALLDPDQPAPVGLSTWNGSDPAARFGVYRNNVAVSLIGALADTFPVTRELVGAPFFDAMARCFVAAEPPRSPVLAEYGNTFPDFVSAFPPAAGLPYLRDLARLELARVHAYHATDADALGADALAAYLDDPARLPTARLTLHPSLAVIASDHAIVSLWAAHQGHQRIEEVDPGCAESALVLRQRDDALVLAIPRGTAAFVAALSSGAALGEAATVAAPDPDPDPDFSLAQTIALLIRHGGIAAWHQPGDLEQ